MFPALYPAWKPGSAGIKQIIADIEKHTPCLKLTGLVVVLHPGLGEPFGAYFEYVVHVCTVS
jgi:hypothetical protein